jgi:hypothetical protein
LIDDRTSDNAHDAMKTHEFAATLHINWSPTAEGYMWPGPGEYRSVSALQIASEDIIAAALFLRQRFCHLMSPPPLILAGSSFGGPSTWAAASRLSIEHDWTPTAVISLAGSARGGSAFESLQLDTLPCAIRCIQAGAAALFLHSLEDVKVVAEVSFALYSALAATGQSALSLVVVDSADHNLKQARRCVFPFLRDWIHKCLDGTGIVGPTAERLHANGSLTPFSVPAGVRLAVSFKGYSEIET